jgi:hypothetical protein
MEKDLDKIAGVDDTIELNGKELILSPLRLRDMITIEKYAREHGDLPFASFEIRTYSLFIALHSQVTLEFINDLSINEARQAFAKLDAISFPSEVATEA